MKKRILLIGYNYYPEFTGIGKYSGEMIYWLAKNGYDCTVITTYPYYPQWKVNPAYEKKRFWYSEETKDFSSGGRIKVYRCPMYIPANPSGFKRMVLDFSFLLTAGLKLIQVLFGKKRDLVITIAPSFLVGLLGVVYKTMRSSKLMYHIQDLQIEAARDLNMIKSKAVINILFAIEKFILTRCNYITSISDEMVKKIQGKVGKEVHLLVNPVDISVLYPIQNREILKAEFGFDTSDKVFLYSGAIGEKQGLEAILHAADELREHKEMKFIICGSGPYKEKLINLANTLQLENVTFLPLQPLTKLNQFLNLADVHFVIQKASASDLVMPSKLTSILSVGGLSIVTANPGSGLYDLVDQNGIGVLVESENHIALVEGIKNAAYIENKQIRENARQYAVNNLSIDGVMGHFERFLNFDTGNEAFPVAQGQPIGVTSEAGNSGR